MTITDRGYEDLFDEMLDECYPDIHIGNLTYTASQALKAVDPIAYREGLADYVDSLGSDE